MGPKIPDRWLPYSPMGSIVPGTRFIACKVPLKDELLRSLPENERFGPKDLLEAFPKIGLLIDLTNTTRYYFKKEFTDKNILYEKIYCPGHVIPPNSIVKQFFHVVDDYLASEQDPDAVIVVHCTHGVNRTGYFICRYMIERMKVSPEDSLKNFQMARGHDIERNNYVNDLKNGCKGGNESDLRFVPDAAHRVTHKRNRHSTNFNDTYRFDKSYGKKRFYNNMKHNEDFNGQFASKSKRPNLSTNLGTQRQPEKDKYAYNWRDRGNNWNTSTPSTTPLPQFTPAPHQTHHQPQNQYRRVVYTPQEHFTGPPPESVQKVQHRGFRPLPKLGFPVPSEEAACSSRPSGTFQEHYNQETARHTPSTTGPRKRHHGRGRPFNRARGRRGGPQRDDYAR